MLCLRIWISISWFRRFQSPDSGDQEIDLLNLLNPEIDLLIQEIDIQTLTQHASASRSYPRVPCEFPEQYLGLLQVVQLPDTPNKRTNPRELRHPQDRTTVTCIGIVSLRINNRINRVKTIVITVIMDGMQTFLLSLSMVMSMKFVIESCLRASMKL